MWINGGGDGFGGPGVPGQTFMTSAAGTGCWVEMMIHKNDPAAGDLRVALRNSDFTPRAARILGLDTRRIIAGEDPEHVRESQLRLARAGIGNVIGYLAEGVLGWI